MRIGLDCRTTEGLAGVAQYGRKLCDALLLEENDEFVIFRRAERTFPFWTAHVSDRLRFVGAKLDLLHVMGGAAPWGYRHPYVMTVHDLAIYRHPEWFPEGQWFSTKAAYPSSIRHARAIIVPSVATKKELVDIFRIKEDKIAVVPHGVSVPSVSVLSGTADGHGNDMLESPDIAAAAPGEGGRYILYLGTIEPRKNIPMLVRAYRLMVDGHPELSEVELRLAGAVGWRSESIIDEIRKTQCEGYRISMVGEVSEENKWKLLGNASCFAYPSLYEGFGMPVTEAFACGVPVVCSNAKALNEVSGGAAIEAEASDAETWARNFVSILSNKKTAALMREKGLARARDFSWEKAAAQTREIYRRAIA